MMSTSSKGSPIGAGSDEKPLRKKYFLANKLRDEILSGKFSPGAMLPSEAQLIKRFAVSRTPVREAIEILRTEGLVTVHHGKGAVVKLRSGRASYTHIRGLIQKRGGVRSRYRDPDVEDNAWEEVDDPRDYRINANVDLALAIGVREHSALFVFERLLERPYGHRMSHKLYIPYDTLDEVRVRGDKPFQSSGELYAILERDYQLQIKEVVRVQVVPPDAAARLSVPLGSPIFFTRRVVTAVGGRPFAMEESCMGVESVELVYDLSSFLEPFRPIEFG